MRKLRIFLIILIVVVAAAAVILSRRKTAAPAVIATSSTFSTATLGVVIEPTASTTIEVITETVPPAAALALPPEDEASARLTVPEGFAIRIFADDLNGRPRFMAVSPQGDLYVSLYGGGQIALLADRNGDGLADSTEIVAGGLNGPHGLEWYEGWLYVAEVGRISRLRDGDNNGSLETMETVTQNIPGSGGHSSRTLHFGPDGMLYVSAGSSCNICAESDPRRAAIMRFNPDGSIPADNPFANDPDTRKQAVWAWGLRNSVDFLWTTSGQLWANHNGRDNLLDAQGSPDSLPPEEIIILVQGNKSHGWPYCYTDVLGFNSGGNPEVADNQTGLAIPDGFDCSLANVVPALFTDLAHSAPLGMTLGDASLAFPAEYRNSLYVAYHGSWNTSAASIRDCKLERILLDGETPVGSEIFVTGWRAEGATCGSASTWGRPADVIVGGDGALYISDDKGDRVYRIVFIGQ